MMDRKVLETEVFGMIKVFAAYINKKEVDDIAEHLNLLHDVSLSDVYSIFNDVNNISKLDDKQLYSFANQLKFRIGFSVNWKGEY